MPRPGSKRVLKGAAVLAVVAATMPLLVTPAAAADDHTEFSASTPAELAAAITAANLDDGPEAIMLTEDMTLTSSLPLITGPLTISGTEPGRDTIVDTAGFRLAFASGASWTEPVGAPDETRLAVKIQNMSITGGTMGGGSMMLYVRVHATVQDVLFFDNVGGSGGNVHAKEAGTSLRLEQISVTGQTGTLLGNDHGSAPRDTLDGAGNPTLTDAQFDDRMYIDDSSFTGNTGCVIYTHRFVSISDSAFSDSGVVCLNGVSTRRIARTTFADTALEFYNPWSSWGVEQGPAYVQLDSVSIRPSVTVWNATGAATHLVVNDTTLCGAPIESYDWVNPITAEGTVIGGCAGVPPTWTEQELPELRLGSTVDDGVSAAGDPEPTYAVSLGALPAGLVLDATTGQVTGVPIAAGDYAFTLEATNAQGSVTADFSGSIPFPVIPSVPTGPETLLVPDDGAAGDRDGTADGRVEVQSRSGLRITLRGVGATTPASRLVVTDQVRPLTDRGMAATGVPVVIDARDITVATAEVCAPVDAASVQDRASDRIRLLESDGATERDITTETVQDSGRLLVCGATDRLGTYQAVLLAGDRIAGADRYETAAAVALAQWDRAETVFVASGETHADAAVAGVLAAAHDAPVVLVATSAIPAPSARALTALQPGRIVVIGGSEAVQADVVAALASYAPIVEVAAGTDRHGTAARVAGDDAVELVYLAAGDRFADAITAGSAAARAGATFLTTDRGSLPPATRAALETLDPQRVVVAGGSSAVSDDVVREVEQLLPDATVLRIGGTDRYETSLDLSAGSGTVPVVAATGASFPDLVVALPFAAGRGASIVLVPPVELTSALRTELTARQPEHVTVVGGSDAVSSTSELGLARVQPLTLPRPL